MPDKLFTVVAGVNGVGKSTYISKLCEKPNDLGHIVDPDQLAVRHGNIIAGGRVALKEIYNCIVKKSIFARGTTLAGKHVVGTIKKNRNNT